MKFTDHRDVPDAFVFDGMAGVAAIGVNIAPVSFGYREFNLGEAGYVPGTGQGATGQIEIGGFASTGSSTVTYVDESACDCDEQ